MQNGKPCQFTRVTPDLSSPEFADYLLQIAEHYPGADTIHLVMDNLSSHTRKAVVGRFGEKAGGWLWERFTVHYTPKTRKLAQSGGDRNQPVLPAVSGAAKNPVAGRSAAGSQGLEPENEP